MKALTGDDLFTPVTSERSGITSYHLRSTAGYSQQSLYFSRSCCDRDFRYLWFARSTPWAGTAASGRMLGVVDLVRREIRSFGDMQFTEACAVALPDTGEVVWCNTTGVWRRGPLPDSVPSFCGGLPYEMIKNRFVRRVATQISLSADGKHAFLDSRIGPRSILGTVELESKTYTPHFSSPLNFNHAQFSPTDPDLVLLARDDDVNFITGETTPYDHRMFLYDLNGRLTPFGPSGRGYGHEVWSADGKHVWIVAYRQGVMRVPVDGGEAELVWPGTGWHAHVSTCERYIVADHRIGANKGGPAWLVRFLNRTTGRMVEIARMPEAPADDALHQHPHPKFDASDSVVIYTTLVRGVADVAVVPVADLIAATS
jgi:hypothetical protein